MSEFKVGDFVVRKSAHVSGCWTTRCGHLYVDPRARREVLHVEDGLLVLDGDTSSWRSDFFQAYSPVRAAAPDAVNSPQHYQFFPDLEAIEVIARSMTQEQFYGYCLGNRLKYRLRAGNKDKLEQDIAKSDKYSELYEQHRGKCIDAK
ncbi:hypothetical protein [Klebsiella phage Kpn BHU2]|nr:hypothetical protein [Klebsiella phage Kpn BHU1]UJQ69753.1 hypothetical protein [Klebsiella phage Kpn BHU2]